MKQIKIILVDDHQLFLDGLKATLTQDNTIKVVESFTNAEKAFTFLKREKIDLVVTDISMPEINGIEFIKKIKKTDIDVKVLAISMFKPIHYEKGFYDGYLLKETDSSIVLKAIKSIVLDNKSFFLYENDQLETLDFKTKIVSKREKEIIQLISEELTVDDIAEKLFLSRYTVETHKKNIFIKLQVNTNTGLIRKALKLGFIQN